MGNLPVIKNVVDAAGGGVGRVASAAAWGYQSVTDPHEILAIVEEILRKAHNGKLRSFLSRVTQRTEEAVDETAANTILEAARKIFCKGAGNIVKDVVFGVTRCSLEAIGQKDFAQALRIWREIFTNDANRETLKLIRERKSDLALFLIGLIEPAKLYATALSRDGGANNENLHSRYNPYNELDLEKAMNRHAVICQLQRLAKSLSHVFLMGKQDKSLDKLPMNTTLRSDYDHNGNVILPKQETFTVLENTANPSEQWLFVNGIGGEYVWLRLYCEKLRDTFKRDICGVFNRSDGILWDLIECAGERDINGPQNALIARTPSSVAAQNALKDGLSTAFQHQESNGYIVMIAYSQGCLLLRLVLQEFVRKNRYRDAMAARLRVFTFGNPSIDWMGTDASGNRIPLCERVNHTEHFANKEDFVAQLGVLRTAREDILRDRGYLHEKSWLFTNQGEDWIGHLFGTQYSIRAEEYVDGYRSKLFACAGGRPMAA